MALGQDGMGHPLERVVHELTRHYGEVIVDLDAIPDEIGRQFVDAVLNSSAS